MKEPTVLPRNSARGAVVLLPPTDLYPAIDTIRQQHDAQIVRWMPHIPLLFPFKAPEDFEGCLPKLAEVCRKSGPLTVTLSEVRFSKLESGRGALWLACEPETPLISLHQRLLETFPEAGRKTGQPAPFLPHIIVGQSRTHLAVQRIAKELQASWSAVTAEIACVSLVGRERTGPFEVRYEIPLGSGRN